ncbi:putative protein CYCLOPS [Helianthus annuus]|nr:putative protein CYCLOPS [Helianthus annuus]KAJ0598328.1 putative protein CYCLOPS [Helianthus annuus]KAJ0712297.1 putative protein CYCLOPS [Helianthus annuus]KAJ0932837.1 putative protein CYCLOPS [Helianthus annuus]KAJ0935337.1 putative protein CYCLOPS [Helianthus annuus]
MSFASREPSQSESSATAPVISSGFDVCDGPTNSGQAPTKGTDTKEQMHDNLQQDRKWTAGILQRNAGWNDHRSIMAEAKGRTQTPATLSDMQSMLKRCENLEKEVRSLKLNLAFMNRKDSEQTKQVEELQKQNEKMRDEKESLLEEIERI